MKQSRLIMGMPVVIEVADSEVDDLDIIAVFDHFRAVDNRFSTYKPESEISLINAGAIAPADHSLEMQLVFALCEQTKQETQGYFDISRDGKLDPSGLVKGWAIHNAAKLLAAQGYTNYYVEAGGDIQVSGVNAAGESWRVGIRNPFNHDEHVKVISASNMGIATSGTAARGQHVYNPHSPQAQMHDVVSLTVIGPNIYEADRFATAAFAMQREGIYFIESLPGLEAYMIDKDGMATYTDGFSDYISDK